MIVVFNIGLFDAITLATAWCDKMLYLFTLYAATGGTDGAYVFSAEDNNAWVHPDEFVRLQGEMPATWKAAQGRVRALLALQAARPIS